VAAARFLEKADQLVLFFGAVVHAAADQPGLGRIDSRQPLWAFDLLRAGAPASSSSANSGFIDRAAYRQTARISLMLPYASFVCDSSHTFAASSTRLEICMAAELS
jgi:hypothetical protein